MKGIAHKLALAELPPRARRILEVWMDQLGKSGTTSACAENTVTLQHQRQVQRNYLRVRGEYHGHRPNRWHRQELPPRARRIHLAQSLLNLIGGTTSACAENTRTPLCFTGADWNYLRVRGEYCPQRILGRRRLELPPRARRIPGVGAHHPRKTGTTSACAENTTFVPTRPASARNYLRVRGEYPTTAQSPG